MNGCKHYQEWISRMLDEELTEQEQDELEAHLAVCPDCAALYAAFSSLSEALSDSMDEPPAGLHENVMAQIRREKLRPVKKPRRLRAVLALAACFALVILASVSLPKLLRQEASARSDAGTMRMMTVAPSNAMKSAPAAAATDEAAAEEASTPMEPPMLESSQFVYAAGSVDSARLEEAEEIPFFSLPAGEQSRRFASLLTDRAARPVGEPLRTLEVEYCDEGDWRIVLVSVYDALVSYAEPGSPDEVFLLDATPEELYKLLDLE